VNDSSFVYLDRRVPRAQASAADNLTVRIRAPQRGHDRLDPEHTLVLIDVVDDQRDWRSRSANKAEADRRIALARRISREPRVPARPPAPRRWWWFPAAHRY
jgi:hypothetical protein